MNANSRRFGGEVVIAATALLGAALWADPAMGQAAGTPGGGNQVDVRVANLRCEYLANPLGIDVPQPRLNWVLESGGRGQRQTGYRVLVASSPEVLADDRGDLWDSGKVASENSTHIEYAGKPLVSRQNCHWKVRVWDKDGTVSAWSAPAHWAMGLLEPEDWRGKWITMDAADGLPHPWLRRTFELESDVSEARVYVNTPNNYELYLNGKKVGRDVLMPAYSNYEKRFFYNVYEVSGLLQKGTNCIALWMGPGWYQPKYGNRHKAPIVRAQLEIRGAHGRSVIATDSRWRVSQSCISQVGSWSWNDMGGERWDNAKYIEDWNQVSFDDRGWAMASEVSAPAVEITWQALPGSRVGEPIPPKRIYPHKDKWVVDFGTTLTGWMRLRMSSLEPGQEIIIDYADIDNPVLSMEANEDGFQTFNQRDIYVAGRETTGTFISKFNQHGFRYAVISGLSQAPALADAEAMTVQTDLEKAGEFSCSNELFNRIHEVTVNTYRTQIPGGVLGGGEPREKEGYGDGGSFLTGLLYNLRSDAFFVKWLRDWRDNQRPDGHLNNTAPAHRAHGGGPSWGGQASELVKRLYLYYGDERAVADTFATLKRYVEYLEGHTDKDILRYFNPFDSDPDTSVQWQFLGDWTPPGESADAHGFVWETEEQREFFNNCYRILLWQQLANYAEVLNDSSEKKRCEDRLAVLRPLIHETFFDAKSNTYRVNRQAYLTIALLSQIMPKELRSEVFAQLERDIVVTRKGHLNAGLQGSSMLLDLLTKENRPDLVAAIMNQETFPGWGYLLKEREVTSWPETWSGWGSQLILVVGTPGAWFYEGLAGIRPDPARPGFKQSLIRPGMVNTVDWVKCRYSSPYGDIVSNWQRRGDRLTMNVSVPVNTTATVYVPAKDVTSVIESGVAVKDAKGVRFLRMQDGAAVFSVGSGNYQFVAR